MVFISRMRIKHLRSGVTHHVYLFCLTRSKTVSFMHSVCAIMNHFCSFILLSWGKCTISSFKYRDFLSHHFKLYFSLFFLLDLLLLKKKNRSIFHPTKFKDIKTENHKDTLLYNQCKEKHCRTPIKNHIFKGKVLT